MVAIVNSPAFSSPKLINDWFAKVLPCQNFALYGITMMSPLYKLNRSRSRTVNDQLVTYTVATCLH